MRKDIRKTIMKPVVLSAFCLCCFIPHTHASEIQDLRAEKEIAKEDARDLKAQIEALIKEIDSTEKEMVELGEKILKAEADLLKVEMKIQEHEQELGKNNSGNVYNNGDKTFLEVIIDSGSVADIIKKTMNIKTVEDKQQEQLTKHLEKQENIARMKADLEKDAELLEKKQEALTSHKEKLDKMMSDTSSNLERLDAQIQVAADDATQSRKMNTMITSTGEIISKSNKGAVIVQAAYSQLGVPYVWGGTSPGRGLDCSGLTQYCHRVAGISISRTSGSQRSGGKNVGSIANALPGDIICYSGHVGIYIGDGKMIHAPQTGDVVKVSSVYRPKSILAIKRYW